MGNIEIKHFLEPNLPSIVDSQILELFRICFPGSKNLNKRRYNNEMLAVWTKYFAVILDEEFYQDLQNIE
jgi:hypothetical protein